MSYLSPTYTGARNLALIVVSVLIISAVGTSTVDISLVGLDLSQASLSTVATVCLVMLVIAGFGLIMGWAHTATEPKERLSSRFDFGVSSAVIIIGVSYSLYKIKDINLDFSASPAAVIAVFSYFAVLGWVIAMWLLRTTHFVYLLTNHYDKLVRSGLYGFLLRKGAFKFSAWLLATLYTLALVSGMYETVYRTSVWVGVTAMVVSMVISVISFILPGESTIEGKDYMQIAIEERGGAALRKDLRRDVDKVMFGERANRPMYSAASAGWLVEVERLVESGYDPDADRDRQGWTALMIACAHGHEHVVQVLLDAGANPNVLNNLGRTALMYSCLYGNTDQVRRLVDNGADPNLRGGEDVLPALHKAVEIHSADIVEILLSAGANPKMLGPRGFTAIQVAEQHGHGEMAVQLRKSALDR